MRASIFGADEELPKAREARVSDTVGRLHSGMMENGKPKSLDAWRFTTGTRETAEALAQLFNGSVVETESSAEFFIDVYSDRASVPIILSGTDAISNDWKLWINGELTHHCDGAKFLSDAAMFATGDACGCEGQTFTSKKQRAKAFQGPKPSVEVTFRLADDPELGVFRFVTASWDFVYVLHQVDAALDDAAGEAVADLSLEDVSFTAKNGPMKGKVVTYTKPALGNIRAYADAIAE